MNYPILESGEAQHQNKKPLEGFAKMTLMTSHTNNVLIGASLVLLP